MTTRKRTPVEVERFGVAARKFCAWAEAKPSSPKRELRTARQLLSEVYAAAIRLPDAKPATGDEKSSLRVAAWKKVYRRFGRLPINKYSDLFDPTKIPAETPVTGDLADDLADIYRDLVEGVRLDSAGRHNEALWQWQMNFRFHWGRHAVSALRVLHCVAEVDHEW